MAVTAQASGTQTATVTTEHFLADVAVSGVFTFHVDCVNLAAADSVELRIYQMVLTGGTSRVAFIGTFTGVQGVDDTIKVSVPISNELTDATSLRFSLKQTFGTGRSFPWKVLKHV
jgi:hypothetical protein